MKFIINGNPIPKARHRHVSRGKFIRSYDPQEKEKVVVKNFLLTKVSEALNSENREIAIEASNLASDEFFNVDMKFFMPIPVSFPKRKKKEILEGSNKHNKKPDTSNLIKFYEDAANGVLFPDDSKINKISGEKIYSENPRTEITIYSNSSFEKNHLEKKVAMEGRPLC